MDSPSAGPGNTTRTGPVHGVSIRVDIVNSAPSGSSACTASIAAENSLSIGFARALTEQESFVHRISDQLVAPLRVGAADCGGVRTRHAF